MFVIQAGDADEDHAGEQIDGKQQRQHEDRVESRVVVKEGQERRHAGHEQCRSDRTGHDQRQQLQSRGHLPRLGLHLLLRQLHVNAQSCGRLLRAGDEVHQQFGYEPAQDRHADAPEAGEEPQGIPVRRCRIGLALGPRQLEADGGRRQRSCRQADGHHTARDEITLWGVRFLGEPPRPVDQHAGDDLDQNGQLQQPLHPLLRHPGGPNDQHEQKRNANHGAQQGDQHQPVQEQVAEDCGRSRPRVPREQTQFRSQVIAVLAQVRDWFGLRRQRIAAAGACGEIGDDLFDAAAMHPGPQPRGDVSAPGHAGEIIELSEQAQSRQALQDAQVECRAADAAARQT